MIQLEELLDILFSRKIICFGGEWGRGKTLSMVAYACLVSLRFNIENIISNIPINLKNMGFIPLVETAQFDKISKNTLILHDELPNDLDSRNSLNPRNRFLMNFAKDLRKLHSQEIGTVQYFDFIDVRMNDLLQIIIIPSFVKRYHKRDDIDVQIRLKNKDFRSRWDVIDKKSGHTYNTIINLYPAIQLYDTDFIPNSLAVNHKEFMEHLVLSKSPKSVSAYLEIMNSNIDLNKKTIKQGLITLKNKYN